MRAKADHRIHVEFGDFSSVDFFKIFEKHAVRNANSLGMNEIEIKQLLRYWNKPDKNPFFSSDNSAPTIS